MKKLVILAAFLLILAACAQAPEVIEDKAGDVMEDKEAPGEAMEDKGEDVIEDKAAATVEGDTEFRLIQELGGRNPDRVFGIVENVGDVTGSVSMTGRLSYGKKVVAEGSTVIDNVAPGERVNYEIFIATSEQWTGFKVIIN